MKYSKISLASMLLFTSIAYSYEQEITSEAELLSETTKHPLVIVKFYRPQCPYCIKAAPEYTRLAKEYATTPFLSFNIDLVDTNTVKELRQKYNFPGVPTFRMFQGKKVQATALPIIREMIEEAQKTKSGIPQQTVRVSTQQSVVQKVAVAKPLQESLGILQSTLEKLQQILMPKFK